MKRYPEIYEFKTIRGAKDYFNYFKRKYVMKIKNKIIVVIRPRKGIYL